MWLFLRSVDSSLRKGKWNILRVKLILGCAITFLNPKRHFYQPQKKKDIKLLISLKLQKTIMTIIVRKLKEIEGFPRRNLNLAKRSTGCTCLWIKWRFFQNQQKGGYCSRQFTKLLNVFVSNVPDSFDFQPNSGLGLDIEQTLVHNTLQNWLALKC